MANKNKFDYIDFEEAQTKLWQLAYSEIKRILALKGLKNQRVELPNCETMKSVTLESPDVLILEDCYGRYDYAEFFKDDYLFEVYKGLIQL